MAKYPDEIYTPRAVENRSGVEYDPDKKTVNFAEDKIDSDAEIVAIQTELGLKPRSRARAYRATSAQVIPTGEETKAQLNAETYDNLGEFDPAANYRFTAQKAGYYQVNAAVQFYPAVTAKLYSIFIYRNNINVSEGRVQAVSTDQITVFISDVLYLAENDYLEIFVLQNSGANANLWYTSPVTFVSIHKLSP